MVKTCLFGIFIFNRHFTLIYRFLSDDLFNYLYKRHRERLDSFEEANPSSDEIPFSIDDTIALTLSTSLHFYDQTNQSNSAVKRITLESNIQVFFDEMGENRIIFISDETYDTLVILKAINLFKSLVRFHLGAYPFTKSTTVAKAINCISASLQYYLHSVLTNQALLFESSEYLLLNGLIRGQCNDACLIVNYVLQQTPTLIMITCKDKIVHMQLSNEQHRPSNSDIFLLLLNNTSRSLREQFQADEFSSSTMAHSFRRRSDQQFPRTESAPNMDDFQQTQAKRTTSLPTVDEFETMKNNTQRNIEVVFMKTSNKNLAPFTMYTIPLKTDISVLILVESKHSLACASLSELIHQLNLCINHSQLSYKHLANQIRSLERYPIFVPQLDERSHSSNKLLKILDTTHNIYKSLPKKAELIDQEDERIYAIQDNLVEMNNISVDIFHRSFLESDVSMDTNLLESTAIENLQQRLFGKLVDWFAFIEMKTQGNITISFCQQRFPGLVHFALIDRARGRICSPALFTEEYKNYLATYYDIYDSDMVKEKKIIDFELECLAALQRGCTSYTLTDDYFTYNYTLRLEESNGASMRLYKPFIKSESPGILHYDFYEKLAYENYASLSDQTSISCFELICVHLRFVPPEIVREHCQQLWSTLRELDD